jgi:hypothetical protein
MLSEHLLAADAACCTCIARRKKTDNRIVRDNFKPGQTAYEGGRPTHACCTESPIIGQSAIGPWQGRERRDTNKLIGEEELVNYCSNYSTRWLAIKKTLNNV